MLEVHADVDHAEQAFVVHNKSILYNITDPRNHPDARYWSYRARERLRGKCVWTSMVNEGTGQPFTANVGPNEPRTNSSR